MTLPQRGYIHSIQGLGFIVYKPNPFCLTQITKHGR